MTKYCLAIITLLFITSCKKEYTCNCTKGYISSYIEVTTIKASTKSNARGMCTKKGEAIEGNLPGKGCTLGN